MSNLEQIDQEELLSIARQKTVESRAHLAKVISDLFSEDSETLSDRERSLMSNILQQVIREVESSIRHEISDRLAERRNVPLDLILLLANDEIDVAYPILTRSAVVRDTELIEVIRHRTMEHQLAVAARFEVSESVSDALVETGDETVIKTLIENSHAQISETTMGYLVEQSERIDSFQEPILNRSDLPENLAKRMFLWVSAALRTFIVDSYQLDEETVDDLLEEAAFKQLADKKKGPKASELAQLLEDAGEITAELLIKTLEEGEIRLFIAMFARLAKVREQLVTRIIFEKGGEGLVIACRALGFSRSEFSILFSLSHRNRSGSASGHFMKEHKKALGFFDQVAVQGAKGVLRKWQRDHAYLAALYELERADGG